MVVWVLYDDGSRSYYHSLKNDVQIISIGINKIDCPNYRQIDLSITNPDLIKSLSKLPPPDIILASPPCESWSITDNQRRAFKHIWGYCGESFFTIRNWDFYQQNNQTISNKCMYRDFYKAQATRLNGERTALAVLKIIEHFKPKVWVIENPQTSYIWMYLNHIGPKIDRSIIFDNVAHYNCYDPDFTTKPTIFRSNIELDLKHFKLKQTKKWEQTGNYNIRSSIPTLLVQDIFNQIKNFFKK